MNNKIFSINLNFDSLGEAYGWPKDFINDKEFEKLKLKKNYFIWHGNKKEFGYNRIIY